MNTAMQRILLAAALCLPLLPAQAKASERQLDFTKATRLDVRHSMLGMRNTLIFYTFADQKAVLQLLIDNQDTTFPVSGTIHLFADSTTKEGIDQWINNQHSDGLFPEVPKPILTQPLPAGQCKVTAHQALGKEKNQINAEEFQDYQVTLTMNAFTLEDRIRLTAFTDTARVFVKLQGQATPMPD